jgi:hypothetical protein
VPGRVQIATVVYCAYGSTIVELPGAGQVRVRGEAAVGAKVFIQDGVVQGPAPDLPVYVDVI